jgi:predicted house-cleaning NTP pyrophosphatase (Maf/HAM1 superfamily)
MLKKTRTLAPGTSGAYEAPGAFEASCAFETSGVFEAYERTKVWMAPLSKERISAYISTGEPMDKAGAYGIQGIGATHIPRIEGCYFNVMGLPLYRVARLLEQAGVGLDSPFWKEGAGND